MKSSGGAQESSKKKQAGEYLKNADRLLKQAEFDPALAEVERCLELDPGNFYAHAYKERIISLRAKHEEQAAAKAAAPPLEPPAAKPPRETKPAAAAAAAPAATPTPAPARSTPAAPAKPAEAPAPGSQEEARKRFLEEKRRQEEELRKQAEEARRRAEEELRRRAQELEAMHTNESLERRKMQEEEKRKRGDDPRRRESDESTRKRIEEEIQSRNAGTHRPDDTEAIRAAEADGRARAKEQKLVDSLLEAKELVNKRDLAGAEAALLKISALHPGHAEAEQMLTGLRQMLERSWEAKIKEAESVPRDAALALYHKALVVSYREGSPDQAAAGIIAELRKNLAVTDGEHAKADPEARLEAYAAALKQQTAAGAGDDDPFLARLRKELGISDAQHQKIKAS